MTVSAALIVMPNTRYTSEQWPMLISDREYIDGDTIRALDCSGLYCEYSIIIPW
jgi:hypothetical protein